MQKVKYSVGFLFAFLIFWGCKKENAHTPISGSIGLDVLVKHHNRALGSIHVFLKNNVQDFPGRNDSLYEMRVETDASGMAHFSSLFPGNYFIYAHGWDPGVLDSVWGYKGAILNNHTVSNNQITIGIAVSE